MVRTPKAKDMTRDDQKTLPAAAKQQRPAAVARSMRQAHRHVLQALRNTGLERVRVKALVTGIEYSEDTLFIGLFDATGDGGNHWVFRARVDEPVRKALEERIGGRFGQPYLGAHIIADVKLGLTREFTLTATITSIIEIQPHRDL
jgi:hypothetical protein